MRNIAERAAKSFVEGFAAVAVPALVLFLQDGFNTDWNAWVAWALPVFGGALAAGISAAWNTIENRRDNGGE